MIAPPSMADRDGKIWMDGELVEWRDAKIHVLTHTLHYGCGAFEGVRAYNTVNGTAISGCRNTPTPVQQLKSCAWRSVFQETGHRGPEAGGAHTL